MTDHEALCAPLDEVAQGIVGLERLLYETFDPLRRLALLEVLAPLQREMIRLQGSLMADSTVRLNQTQCLLQQAVRCAQDSLQALEQAQSRLTELERR